MIRMRRVDETKTPPVDPQFRQPSGAIVYTEPFVVKAQLSLGQTKGYTQRPGGDDPTSDGHVTMAVADWQAAHPPLGGNPRIGDRIVALYAGTHNEQSVIWHIIRVERRGHYSMTHFFWQLFYKYIKTEASLG